MTNKQYFVRDASTFGKKINEEFVVINSKTESFYVLNETGETIYRILGRKKTIAQIIDKIIARFAIEAKRLQNDVKLYLREGIEKGLFRVIKSNNRKI